MWRKYLQKPLTDHGAVKIYFGGTWNILVTKPAYINQVLKQDGIFQKAGNHVKNPHSILALYTGENVISAIDDRWKQFVSVIKPGLQADANTSIIVEYAKNLIEILLHEQQHKEAVAMSSPLQQYTLAILGEALLGVNFDVSTRCKEFRYIGE
jgi:unspecific monooxygenase